MAFWNSSQLELKQKSKFIVSFANDFFLPNVKTCSKPSFEINTKEYKLINHTFNYPGTVKWNPVTITFVDFNGNGGNFDTAELLMQMLNNTGYDYPDSASHDLATKGGNSKSISSPEKSSTIANAFGDGLSGGADDNDASYKRQNVKIQMLTPDGKANEIWTLANPMIKSIKFGDLAYDSDEPVEYTIEIIYDFALLGDISG